MFCDNENSQDDAGYFGYAYFIRKPKELVRCLILSSLHNFKIIVLIS